MTAVLVAPRRLSRGINMISTMPGCLIDMCSAVSAPLRG
jgi:hypothetical protein